MKQELPPPPDPEWDPGPDDDPVPEDEPLPVDVPDPEDEPVPVPRPAPSDGPASPPGAANCVVPQCASSAPASKVISIEPAEGRSLIASLV